MKTNEIRKLSNEDINKKIVECKEELFNLRFQHATGNLANPMLLNSLKKDIAKIKTVLTEREIAEKVKKAYPDCVIIFGGHNVPPDNSFLEKYPFIDFLVHGEGEEAFKAIMLEILKEEKDFSKIKNISYRVSEKKKEKTETEILCRLDYPSPYLGGWFDYIFEENGISLRGMISKWIDKKNRDGMVYGKRYKFW